VPAAHVTQGERYYKLSRVPDFRHNPVITALPDIPVVKRKGKKRKAQGRKEGERMVYSYSGVAGRGCPGGG